MDNNYFPDDMAYWGEKPYIPPPKEKKSFALHEVRTTTFRRGKFPSAEVFIKRTTYILGIPIKSKIKKLK